jgi:hypothetical protein
VSKTDTALGSIIAAIITVHIVNTASDPPAIAYAGFFRAPSISFGKD